MLKQLQKRNDSGFTIIEVLIVLAIAGLIMVVVFLAVPGLQRSQRNNSRKTDANNLMASVSDVTSNNGGSFAATDLPNAVKDTKLGFYTTGNITVPATVNSSTVTAIPTKTQVFVYPNYTCGAHPVDTPVPATRQTAVVYSVETGSGVTRQCVSS